MKRLIGIILAVACVILTALPVAAEPWKFANGTMVIRKGEVIEGDLYFQGEYLEVEGEIRGDLLVMAREVKILGKVDGNLLGLVWEKLTVGGVVAEDLRVAAGELAIDGTVGETLAALAINAEINRPSRVGKGLLGHYHQINLHGKIDGPVRISGYAATTIGGKINGNLMVRGVPVKWLKSARVAGNVDDYTGVTDTSGGSRAKITGDYRIHQDNEMLERVLKTLLFFSLIWFMGSILISLITFKLFPRTFWKITEPNAFTFRKYLLTGLMGAFGIPVLIVILFITQVGIPFAILLGLIYLILLLFSNVLLYLWLGRLVFSKSSLNTRRHPVLLIITGGFSLALLGFIPFVGYFVQILGFGMVIGNIRPEIDRRPSRTPERGGA